MYNDEFLMPDFEEETAAPLIEDIKLLSADEASRLLTKDQRTYKGWWWTKTPGLCEGETVDVGYGGTIHRDGSNPGLDETFVRPALKIADIYGYGLDIEDEFMFGGKRFVIVSEILAFCLEDIGTCAFRNDYTAPDANVYGKSDVKKYIDGWFKEALRKQGNSRKFLAG